MKELLLQALERMDRARNILTDGKPTPMNNWGMLDTSNIREELGKLESTTAKDNLWKSVDTVIEKGMEQLVKSESSKFKRCTDCQWGCNTYCYMKISRKVIEPSNRLSNSQITAECIKAGILDQNKIEWIQKRGIGQSALTVDEYIKFIQKQ